MISAFPNLTEREREILGLIAMGHSNADIAEKLVLSPKTVSNHVSNIFSKLQVVDRACPGNASRQTGRIRVRRLAVNGNKLLAQHVIMGVTSERIVSLL